MTVQQETKPELKRGFKIAVIPNGNRGFLVVAVNGKTGKQVKLKLTKTPNLVHELQRLVFQQGNEILCNPETGEYKLT